METQGRTFLEVSQQAVMSSLEDLWGRFIDFFPLLLSAIVVLIIGWIIAVAIGNLIDRVLKSVRINDAFERIAGLQSAFHRAGMKLDVAAFIGALVKWFLIIVFLLAASDILGLRGVSDFLNEVILYVPNIVVAAVIVVAGVLFGNFIQRMTEASVETAGIPHGKVAGAITKWAVYIFAFIAALVQLGVAVTMLQTLFMGLVAMLAIAGGLAFGLGGKDVAHNILKMIEKDFSRHHQDRL